MVNENLFLSDRYLVEICDLEKFICVCIKAE
jgi:hypothetical protein